MALDYTWVSTWIDTLLRLDTTVPGISAAERLQIVNDVYLNYQSALGTISAIVPSSGPFAPTSTSFWTFTMAPGDQYDLNAVDAVESLQTSGVYKPLALVSEDEVRYLQATEGRTAATKDDITMTSVKILHETDGDWVISGYHYPLLLTGVQFQVVARVGMQALALGTDVLKAPPPAVYMIGRIAAVLIGSIMRRPTWLLQRIAEPVDAQMRLVFDLNRLLYTSRTAPARDVLMGVVPPREGHPMPELSRLNGE